MKNTILFLLLSFTTLAQTDSVKVQFSEEKGTLQTKEVIDNSAYVLRLQEPINQLFKLQLGQTPNRRSSFGNLEFNATAAYERKLGKHFSINAGIDFWSIDEGFNTSSFSALIEPRWYFKQEVSNLSGMYVGMRYLQNLERAYTSSYTDKTSTNQVIGINIGVQNRFLRTGLFDISLMAGIENVTNTQPIWENATGMSNGYKFTGNYIQQTNNQWFIRSEARIGLGFSNNSQRYKASSCDVFRCFESQKQWLKVDFTEMFYLSENRNRINIGLDYEFKLGQSSWSINQGLKLRYMDGKGEFTNYNSSGIFQNYYRMISAVTATYDISPRYYYNLKRRIAYGKSANNLSANYLSPIFGFDVIKKYIFSGNSYFDNGYGLSRRHVGFLYGVQRRLIKNGFIDVNAGLARVLDDTFVDGPFRRETKMFVLFNFKVGYAIF
jgi:hypothetical protein